jgi:DNA-binding LacI/PurR family transcriptional regulator
MAEKNGKRASSRDVAKLAGVSQATVSRVFTPGAKVSEEKRIRVLKAAEELLYQPSVIARSLIQRSTKIIGIVVKNFWNVFYMQALELFTERLQKMGYSTMLFNIGGNQSVEESLPIALQYQVDGLIITSATLSSPLVEGCSRYDTPVVLFNRINEDENGSINSVCCDNVEAGQIVADYLVSTGHRNIAFISGDPGSSTSRDRERGFLDRLSLRGQMLLTRDSGDFSYLSGIDAARRILSTASTPDAVFCASDEMALACIDCARNEFSIRVPEDMSVIGFDGIPMTRWPYRNLTTFRQPIEELVDLTVEVLLNALADPEQPAVHRYISGTLYRGGTVIPRPGKEKGH